MGQSSADGRLFYDAAMQVNFRMDEGKVERIFAGFDAARCPEGCIETTLPYVAGPLDGAVTQYARAIADLVDHHDPRAAFADLLANPGEAGGIHLIAGSD